MIYARTKPIEEYVITILNGQQVGLYATYIHNPPLLALVMIGTPLAYKYELSADNGKCIVSINDERPYLKTLNEVVKGKTVNFLLESLNPLEFFGWVRDEDLSHLSIIKEVCQGKQQVFKTMVAARVAAWAENYKGELCRKGNVISVAFNGVTVDEKLTLLNKAMKEVHGT